MDQVRERKWWAFDGMGPKVNRLGLAGDSISREYRVMTNIKRYSPEVRELT